MIIRIVKLTFQEDKTQDFLNYFGTIKQVVNTFPGCQGMKLIQNIHSPNVIMTYSHWDSEKALNNYRDSDTFIKVWTTIKQWFDDKPEAWSMDEYFNGF